MDDEPATDEHIRHIQEMGVVIARAAANHPPLEVLTALGMAMTTVICTRYPRNQWHDMAVAQTKNIIVLMEQFPVQE
jgi:hypothetical protein